MLGCLGIEVPGLLVEAFFYTLENRMGFSDIAFVNKYCLC